MKFFFIVQGEGMGHTTQSLALRTMLEKNGHTVTGILVGTNFFRNRNELYRQIWHKRFFSPVLVQRADKTGINLFRTFIYNILLSPLYFLEILRIAVIIKTNDCEAIIVFYDLVGQLGTLFSFSGKPVYSVSHHFFFDHPAFIKPLNHIGGKLLLRIHSFLASAGSRKILAISFTPEENIPSERLYVIPPLLRAEIINSSVFKGNHIHIYCLQRGFLKSIAALAGRFPRKNFITFLHNTDRELFIPANLEVLSISGDKFLDSIRSAGLVISTAGFETLAEAIYLDKPLVIVPSRGHFEQFCNSLDAKRVNAAIVCQDFNPDELPSLKHNPAHPDFVEWIRKSEEILLKHLQE